MALAWEKCGMCKKCWMGKHEGKMPLGIPRHRWEDNITVHIKYGGWLSTAHSRDGPVAGSAAQ
jgi:hypothetical protein